MSHLGERGTFHLIPATSPAGARFSHRYIETILVNLPKVSAFDIIECDTLGKRLALFDPQLQLTCYRSSKEELGFTVDLSGWKRNSSLLVFQGFVGNQE